MFKFSVDPKFTHDVTVCAPVDGGFKEQTFRATFRVIPVDELGDTATLEGQKQLLTRIVCHFDDVVGEDDKPVPYSDELRGQFIAVPYIRAALVQTYLQAVTKTKLGN